MMHYAHHIVYFSRAVLHRFRIMFSDQIFKGPVLKFNGNQRYATTAITASMMRVVAEKCNIPLQVHIQ